MAQTKNEKESRVQLLDFPKASQATLKAISKRVKRIRYYREMDGEKHSFESKFKYKKHWFSVEFDSLGTIEDIEVTVKKRQLRHGAKTTIYDYLKAHSSKYDIIKIQEQYVYKDDISEVQFLNSILENRASHNSNYEIIIAIKSGSAWELKEMTFDPEGTLLKQRNVQQDSYEYIMY